MKSTAKKKVKIGIVGAGGRMGAEILRLARESNDIEATCGIDSKKVEGLKTVKKVEDLSGDDVDVLIDFSAPDLFSELASWCKKNKKALVSGTTGFTEKQFEALKSASSSVPILWSPNMSLGVSVLNRLLTSLGAVEGFDFQIEETHHRQKKDKPSGTAKLLQKTLADSAGAKLPDPISIRGGGVPGQHRVYAMGEEEVLVLEHTAFNRAVFARGALKAAVWLAKAKPGRLYGMEDVLWPKR